MTETNEKFTPILQQTEDLFFALGNNLSLDGRDNAFHIIEHAKKHYNEDSEAWEKIMVRVQEVINSFENDFSQKSEMTLLAIRQQAQELIEKHSKLGQ